MDNIHGVKETTLNVGKKLLVLAPPYLGSISLQTRIKWKKSLQDILNCCELRIMSKNKTSLGNNFHFKNLIHKDLTFGVVYKFHCEFVRNLNVRNGEHIATSKKIFVKILLLLIVATLFFWMFFFIILSFWMDFLLFCHV